MRVVRQTPMAINKPLLVVGIDRVILALLLCVCTVIAAKLNRAIGIALFFGGCYAAKRANRKDPDLLPIARQAWKLKAIYCPLKREVK